MLVILPPAPDVMHIEDSSPSKADEECSGDVTRKSGVVCEAGQRLALDHMTLAIKMRVYEPARQHTTCLPRCAAHQSSRVVWARLGAALANECLLTLGPETPLQKRGLAHFFSRLRDPRSALWARLHLSSRCARRGPERRRAIDILLAAVRARRDAYGLNTARPFDVREPSQTLGLEPCQCRMLDRTWSAHPLRNLTVHGTRIRA